MKHPKYPPEYASRYPRKDQMYYFSQGAKVEYIVIVHRKTNRSVANIDEDGRFWEIWDNPGSNTETKFPSLDEALRYAEAKMALGILGERE